VPRARSPRGAGAGTADGIPSGARYCSRLAGAPDDVGRAPLRTADRSTPMPLSSTRPRPRRVLVAKLGDGWSSPAAWAYRQRNASSPARISRGDAAAWSGGSSSGSAGRRRRLVPFAIGRRRGIDPLAPRAYCGVTGLRPTYGRVSRHGEMGLMDARQDRPAQGQPPTIAASLLEAIRGPTRRLERGRSDVSRTTPAKRPAAPFGSACCATSPGRRAGVRAHSGTRSTRSTKIGTVEEVTLPDRRRRDCSHDCSPSAASEFEDMRRKTAPSPGSPRRKLP